VAVQCINFTLQDRPTGVTLNGKMKKELQLAEEAIDRNEFDVAADHCNTALESDENSYDARM
jgi:hypothetical protein